MTQGNEAIQMGLHLRDQGLDSVESHNLTWSEKMRKQARRICMAQGHVTTDDLHAYATLCDLQPTHRNAWGGIFRGKHWKCIGRCRSTRPSAHAREIRIWAYQ